MPFETFVFILHPLAVELRLGYIEALLVVVLELGDRKDAVLTLLAVIGAVEIQLEVWEGIDQKG